MYRSAKESPMHNIVSMYLLYRVSCIIVANVSKRCVLSFTLHGFRLTPTCVLQFLVCAATKGENIQAKCVLKKLREVG
jgi:hypothetical protein